MIAPRQAVTWLGILISIAMLVWVYASFDFDEALRALRSAELRYIFPVVVVVLLDCVLRAVRWGALFDYPRPTVGSRFIALMVGYLGNNVFPARAGQLVRIYLLGQRENVGKGAVLATVVVEHVIDLAVIFALSSLVLISYPMPAWFREAGFVLATLVLGALFLFILFCLAGRRVLPIMVRLLQFLPERVVFFIRKATADFMVALSSLLRERKMVLFLFWTTLIWAAQLIMILLAARAFHLNLNIMDGLVVLSALGLGTMVPSSPGYVGTYEFFAVNALKMVGVVGGVTLSFALSLHAVIFLAQGLLGLGCMAACGIDAYRLLALRTTVSE